MAVYVVTGKLGSGKTLVAVSKIRDYLVRGSIVATNLDLNIEHLINPFSKNARVLRVSDRPTVDELNALPLPYEGDYDEKKAGLLVFDECATWFNSRTWNDKGRKDLIDWLLHARKLGWDIIFIIQNVSMMDAQAREGFAEMVVHCRRLDRLAIPFLSFFGRLGGFDIRPPKVHWGIVKYGASDSSPMIERWVYTGTDLYKAYDTRQVFTESSDGFHSVLPPNTIYGRNTTYAEHHKRGLINAINRFTQTTKPRAAFLIGLLSASVLTLGFNAFSTTETVQQAKTEKKAIKPSNQPVSISDIEGVYITASVKSTRSFDYVFQRGEEVIYPQYLDYQVRFINDCKASLFRGDTQVYVTCSPYHAAPSKPQPREGAVARGVSDIVSGSIELVSSD